MYLLFPGKVKDMDELGKLYGPVDVQSAGSSEKAPCK